MLQFPVRHIIKFKKTMKLNVSKSNVFLVVKVHSFLKQCLHDLCLTRKVLFSLKLWAVVVSLKDLVKVPLLFQIKIAQTLF